MYFRMPRVFSPLQAELGLQSGWKCCILQNKINKRYKLNNNFFFFSSFSTLKVLLNFYAGRVGQWWNHSMHYSTNKVKPLVSSLFHEPHLWQHWAPPAQSWGSESAGIAAEWQGQICRRCTVGRGVASIERCCPALTVSDVPWYRFLLLSRRLLCLCWFVGQESLPCSNLLHTREKQNDHWFLIP